MSQALLLEVKCHLPQDGSKRLCSQEGDRMQTLCITFENALIKSKEEAAGELCVCWTASHKQGKMA